MTCSSEKQSIEVGDVVCLLSGGPRMVVECVVTDATIMAVWIGEDGIFHRASVHPKCLCRRPSDVEWQRALARGRLPENPLRHWDDPDVGAPTSPAEKKPVWF